MSKLYFADSKRRRAPEQKMKNNNQPNYYVKYWTEEEVSKELEAKTLSQGKIRINTS